MLPKVQLLAKMPSTPRACDRNLCPAPRGSSYSTLMDAAFLTTNVDRPQSSRRFRASSTSPGALSAPLALSESPSQGLGPRIDGPEVEAVRKALPKVHLQRVV